MPKINIKTDFADGEILYGEQLNQVTAPVELAMNTHDDEIEALQLDIDNLVLTDNNYTNAEKIKLEGIATGAEVNVQSDWNQTINTADDYIKNKPTIPETNQFALKTNVLELDNSTEFVPDADYEPATKKYVDDHSSTYTLPIASETTLGGIKIGDNLTVTEDGTLNAEEQGGTYELPIAGETTLGGIKIGDNLSIEIDGTLNASGGIETETDPVFTAWDKDYDDLTNKPTIPTQYTDELAQDAVGGMVDSTLTYTDGTPELKVTNPVTPQTTGFTITAGTTPKTLTVGLDASVSGTNTGDQDLSGYLTSETDPVFTAWDKDYDDLTNKPTIPTKTSDLTNDSNFVEDANYVHTDNNFTTTLKNKLGGIADGAEVNVNADWNATTGDSQILNKPAIPTRDSLGLDTDDTVTFANLSGTNTGDLDSTFEVSTFAELKAALENTTNIVKHIFIANGNLTIPSDTVINPWRENYIYGDFRLRGDDDLYSLTINYAGVESAEIYIMNTLTVRDVPNIIINGVGISGTNSVYVNNLISETNNLNITGAENGVLYYVTKSGTITSTIMLQSNWLTNPVSNLTKATGTDINTGTDDAKYVTSKAIEDSNLIRSVGDSVKNIVHLTKAQYDAISTKDENTIYNVTDETDNSITVENVLTSTSATNALSANMGRELNTRHIMTGELTSTLSITGTSATKIPLASYNSTGTKLSIASDGIKIGAGVNKVLVSAQAAHATLAAAGLKQLRIYKNETQTATTRTQIATANSTINISQYLIDVAENDIIYLYYVGVNGDTVGVGVNYDTWLTVEVVA